MALADGGNFTADGVARDGQRAGPVSAEMLSPDETVQLIANVVQKMAVNQTH